MVESILGGMKGRPSQVKFEVRKELLKVLDGIVTVIVVVVGRRQKCVRPSAQ